MGKAAVIKPWVSPQEKGVVFFSFEDQWLKLLRYAPLHAFAERYDVVVAPTWSPPHHLVNFVFPKAFAGPVFCLISNWKDLEHFPRFAANYVMVPLFASSWVNPVFYKPVPFDQKNIDFIMVANFGTYKRHHVLFKARATCPTACALSCWARNRTDARPRRCARKPVVMASKIALSCAAT